MNQLIRRRAFIQTGLFGAVGFATASVFEPLQLLASSSPAGDGYKALVCIGLDGGCDGNNVIVPLSTNTYSQYQNARGLVALPQSSLIPCDDGAGNAYGFHGSLPQLTKLYANGNAAVLANVGPLTSPVTKDIAMNNFVGIPTDLFNHELQRYQWATSYTVTGAVHTYSGWGGRIADYFQNTNSGIFPTVSSLSPASSEQAFCYGQSSYPAVITPGSQSQIPPIGQDALNLIANTSSNAVLIGAAASGLKDTIDQSNALQNALAASVTPQVTFPSTSIGAQLSQVLQMINARGSLGMQRQIFLCVLTGFDTHTSQLQNQGTALAQLDDAVGAFYTGLCQLGLQNQVTTFTTSDFGRTLLSNTDGGTDHAWGNHQIIIGGAVTGKAFYGTFPNLTLNGPDDWTGQGRWIPTTSIDQYGATLASWFGVPDSNLGSIFPNLANFSTKKLGFL